MYDESEKKRIHRLKILLTGISVLTVVLAGLNIYQYELQRASIPVQPSVETQQVNASLLNGIMYPDSVLGIPLTLTWPALLTGTITSNASIYFYINFEYHGAIQLGTNAGTLPKVSTYLVGPQKIINVSVELPPGKWWLDLYEPNSFAEINTYNFTITYTFYTPKTSNS